MRFKDSIAQLLQRLKLKPDRSKKIQQEQKDWAEALGRIAIADMLADFRAAGDRYLKEGKGFDQLSKDFGAIATRYGWQGRDGQSWRAGLTASTNLRSTYGAGQQERRQMEDVRSARPGLMWVHGNPLEPRLHHKAMDGLIFDGQDEFWSGFVLPSGYGCTCRLQSAAKPAEGYAVLSDRLPYKLPNGKSTEVPAVKLGNVLYPVVDAGFLNPFGGLTGTRSQILEQMIERQPEGLKERVLKGLGDRLKSFLPERLR